MSKNAGKYDKKDAIGIFDSGVGGLTVVSEVIKALPNENIIYFGDTARVPYGSKSKETVTKYSKQIMNFLISKNVKAVIVACNTASSNSYDELVQSFDVPIIEVVRPGVQLCLSTPDVKNVGVIGTERTIISGAYEKFLKAQRPDITVFSKACPLFVPLAEEGWTDNDVSALTAKMYLQDFYDKDIDALILGCTHYPLLKDCIQKTLKDAVIINPAEAAAFEIKRFLEDKNCLNDCEESPVYTFFASDNTEKFNAVCKTVLGKSYNAEIIDIEKY